MTGLKALENICNQCEHYQFEKGLRPKKCPFNKSCVFKQRIKNELKALEMIKNTFDIAFDDEQNEISFYDDCGMVFAWKFKSKEKYNSLKEVMGNESNFN